MKSRGVEGAKIESVVSSQSLEDVDEGGVTTSSVGVGEETEGVGEDSLCSAVSTDDASWSSWRGARLLLRLLLTNLCTLLR